MNYSADSSDSDSFHQNRQFFQYIDAIEKLARGQEVSDPAEWRRKMARCLDGEPGQVVRREMENSKLRKQGAFFTGKRMATKLANAVNLDSGHLYLDPTCGAGDLLLGIAKKMSVSDTLTETLADWGRCLAGCDIFPDFLRLAKARLVLLAAKRCRILPSEEGVELSHTFPKIVEADFLSYSSRVLQTIDVVIMNPPFGYTLAPAGCEWAKGRVCAAALFAERAIRDSPPGTQIVAILPDVLRSGSRYERWRSMIGTLGSIRRNRPLGLFDRWADVDVFLLDFLKNAEKQENRQTVIWPSGRLSGGIGKRFAVHVGPVVPHRDKEVGPEVCYIHARSLPAWSEHKQIDEKRKFSGRLFDPPFVVVRRTSRPDDKKRAVATVILGKEAVAVENHLIVLVPGDGSIRTCRELIVRLQSSRTDEWINKRLRCRHLTTGVLAGMPWWNKL